MSFLAPSPRSRRREEADSFVATEGTRRSRCNRRSDGTEGFGLLEASAFLRRRLRPQRRCWRRGWFGFALRDVKLPEQLPVSLGHRVNVRVARNNRATVRPINLSFHQSTTDRIRERVEAEPTEGVAFSFLFAQDVIVRLMLPLPSAAQHRLQMRSQEFHSIQMISFAPHSHPHEMKMVGHQAVGWTEKLFACGGVEHQLPELEMKCRRQPSASPFLKRIRPEHNGVALISMPLQTWEFAFARWSHFGCMQAVQVNVNNRRRCSRRRKEADSLARSATSSRRCVRLPPPYVGGYNAI